MFRFQEELILMPIIMVFVIVTKYMASRVRDTGEAGVMDSEEAEVGQNNREGVTGRDLHKDKVVD
jgi:hypothetical protein